MKQRLERRKKMVGMMIIGAALFVLLGIILHIMAWVQDFTQFQPLLEEYWTVDKTTRDAAPAGSELAKQLAVIKQFPPKLTLFKLVGIGSILVGVWISLIIIGKRLEIMPMKLASILKK